MYTKERHLFILLRIYIDNSDKKCFIYLNVIKINTRYTIWNNINITTMSKVWKLFKSVLNFPIFNKYIEIKKIESQNHIYYKLSDKYFINIRNLLWQTSFTIRFFLIENHAIQIPYIYHTKHTAWEIPQSITNRRNRGKKERGKKKNGHGAPCVDGTPYSIDRIPLLRFPVDVLVI